MTASTSSLGDSMSDEIDEPPEQELERRTQALADSYFSPIVSLKEYMPSSVRELAKWHIYRYVKRGDPLSWLRRGGMSYGGRFGEVQIHLDHIMVHRVGPHRPGIENSEIARFSLAELYREIKAELRHGEVQQARLFDRPSNEGGSSADGMATAACAT